MSTNPSGAHGHPGAEATSIGNDPASGATTQHDIMAPPGAGVAGVGAAPEPEPPHRPLPQGVLWETPPSPGPGLVAADAFDGQRLENPEGEVIGRIERLVLDLACGRIAYVVVELAAFAGGKLCAIPWPALEVEPQAKRLRVTLNPDEFHQAPTFDRDAWPVMEDEAWAEEVHAFFGCRPYWV